MSSAISVALGTMATTAPTCLALPCSAFTFPKRHTNAASTILSFPSHRFFASIEICNPDDFQVQRLLGTYGYMNVTSYAPPSLGGTLAGAVFGNSPTGYDERDVQRMSAQEVGEGGVQTRLYAGRVSRGQRMGTRVILKAYPGRAAGGIDADAMAANELATHAVLQDISEAARCKNLVFLFGGFQTSTGEQWLVFRDDGQITAADYAKAASKATADGQAVGQWEFLDTFDNSRPIKRRRVFIIKLLRGAFSALAYMHSRGQIHQSLGPASVVINIIEERDVLFLESQLRDLAFAVDISDDAILSSRGNGMSWKQQSSLNIPEDLSIKSSIFALSQGLWQRAKSAGAIMPMERKAFGIADDIYAAGFLMAYMIFVPLCEPGSIDGPSLQRLFESTFRLDFQAAREYCLADDRWSEAVKFLDLGDGAGWELLQAMLNPDYRQRPIVEAVLNHRFMTGAVL